MTNDEPRLGEEPSGLQPVNLGAVFAHPDRSAGLRELASLNKRPPASSVSKPEVADAQVKASPSKTTTTTTKKTKNKQPEPPAQTPNQREPEIIPVVAKPVIRRTSTVAPVVVYVPASLQERLKAHTQAAEEMTYTEVLFDALDELHTELDELLTGARSGRREGSLFQGRERLRQRHNEPQVQVTLRPTKNDLAVIDRLVREHKASSRSTFVARILDAYLSRRQN